MPTPIGHSLLGLSIMAAAYGVEKPFFAKDRVRLAIYCVVVACLPDADFMHLGENGFTLTPEFHHGMTHSLGFAAFTALVTAIAAMVVKRKDWRRLGILTFALIASHVAADFFGVDGYARNGIGVPALWPLSGAYYIFPALPSVDRTNVFAWASIWAMAVEILVFGGIFALSLIIAVKKRTGR